LNLGKAVQQLKREPGKGLFVGGGFGGHVLGLFAPGGAPPPGAVPVYPGGPAAITGL
jgi:predicted alpha/beta hydrolase